MPKGFSAVFGWNVMPIDTWNNVIERFSDAIALIEQLEIEGHKLIDIMNDIEEVEVF